jgi:glyoxylase-like metal-dependent hydrolase (beta-lactamase superfamily II)
MLPLPFDLASMNAYLLQGETGWCLVDCGLGTRTSDAALVAGLAELGLRFADLDALVLTHSHPDHIGPMGLIAAQMAPTAPVFMQATEVDELYRVWDGEAEAANQALTAMRHWGGLAMEDARIAAEGMHQLARYVRLPPRERITVVHDGETLRLAGQPWRVLETPGHADGHICLVSDEAIILGDHILPRISPNLSLYPGTRLDPVRDYEESLQKVAALGLVNPTALPGHGAVIPDLPTRITELHASVARRSGRALATLREHAEPQTALTVTETIFQGRLHHPADRWMALGEIQAHLEHLVLSGQADRAERDGMAYYQAS